MAHSDHTHGAGLFASYLLMRNAIAYIALWCISSAMAMSLSDVLGVVLVASVIAGGVGFLLGVSFWRRVVRDDMKRVRVDKDRLAVLVAADLKHLSEVAAERRRASGSLVPGAVSPGQWLTASESDEYWRLSAIWTQVKNPAVERAVSLMFQMPGVVPGLDVRSFRQDGQLRS